MTPTIAIIGDHFMLPSAFETAIRAVVSDGIAIRSRQDAWPDEPMEHGYAVAGLDGLKEYFGTPDDVVDFVGDAQILVTHLAPMSRGCSNACRACA
jgi:D-3-phosphoglycerate dehydrogenase / 2-oxoglutarate reductase